ncbi:MAG: hypothetical protein Aurels2KO_19920 [Aureliella sp.]
MVRVNDQNPSDSLDAFDLPEPKDASKAGGSAENGAGAAVSSVATGATVFTGAAYKPLSEKIVKLDRWIGYAGMSVLLLVIVSSTAPTFLIPQMPWWGVAVIALLWVILAVFLYYLAHMHPRWAFDRTSWAMTPEGFEIRRGIIWRHHIAIPAARVQHVDVSQGPLQRLYDLGKLTIHTAGTANASVELNGLEHTLALELRDELIRQKELLDDA